MAYEIRGLLASPSTYTAGRGGCDVEYIAVHYTATQASAYDNCRYFSGGNRNSSAHYFIDGSGTVWRSVPDADTAWAVGNFPMNQRSISIEVVSDGRDFTEEEIAELRWLVQRLRAQYGIPAENVIRHYDAVDFARRAGLGGSWVDPHKSCPAPYVDHDRWHDLWLRIAPDAAGDGGQADADIRYMQGLARPMCERAGIEPPAATGQWTPDTQRALVHLAQTELMATCDPTLYPSGEIGGQSRAVMDAHPVKAGDAGLAAWAVKAALVGHGYKGADVGGVWSGIDLTGWTMDEVAVSALRRFQAESGLPVTGEVDDSGWCTLCPNMYSDNPNR